MFLVVFAIPAPFQDRIFYMQFPQRNPQNTAGIFPVCFSPEQQMKGLRNRSPEKNGFRKPFRADSNRTSSTGRGHCWECSQAQK
jgi:hypothetical protein